MKTTRTVLLLLISIFQINAFATEKDTNAIDSWPKHNIQLSYGISSHEDTLKLGTTGIGIEINAEDTLGLKSTQNSLRFDYLWRYSENRKHSVEFNLFRFC